VPITGPMPYLVHQRHIVAIAGLDDRIGSGRGEGDVMDRSSSGRSIYVNERLRPSGR
jgi:hypothetical protein